MASEGKKRGKRATGHYADPLSPIASTPLKRQRTKSAENAKSAKAKHLPQSEARGTPVKAAEDQRFLSPRKLDDEFDSNEVKGQAPGAAAAASNGTTSEQGEAAGDAEEVNQVMFSPTLKPPKCSRSVSASPTRQLTRQESHSLAVSPRLSRQESHGLAVSPRLSRQESHGAAAVSSSSAESTPEKVEEAAESVAEEVYDDDADANDVPSDQEFNPFFFMKTLPSYDEVVQTPRPTALPERTRTTPNICLVLDLDETLVHCSVDDVVNPHLRFPVNFNGVDYTVNVKKRPHMEYFLRRVSKLFEVVVFTASHKAYAEKLLNLLDPHRHLIKYRLYREDCLDVYGNYLKDLNVLGRDLAKVVLVDNSPHAFGYQVNNGIPIETWYEDESDDELLNLLPFLESLIDLDDVRPVVEKQFQIQKLIDATPDEEIV